MAMLTIDLEKLFFPFLEPMSLRAMNNSVFMYLFQHLKIVIFFYYYYNALYKVAYLLFSII